MDKDRYEKHISSLEEEVQMLKASLKKLSDNKEIEIAKHFKTKGQFSRGLLLFLNQLYQKLSEVQHDIMKNIGRLSEENLSLNQEVSSRVAMELNKMLAIEDKTSGDEE